jgi:hypothetical protein
MTSILEGPPRAGDFPQGREASLTPDNLPVRVPLGRGFFSLVDADDAERVLAMQWNLRAAPSTYYAVTSAYVGRGDMQNLHRFIMKPDADQSIDHINGNGLDNRKQNLRVATQAENVRNSFKTTAQTSSRFKGVSLKDGAWRAQIKDQGYTHNLGDFAFEVDAAKAYDVAAVQMFKQYARTNAMMGLYDSGETELRYFHTKRNAFPESRSHHLDVKRTRDERELERLIATQKTGSRPGVVNHQKRLTKKPKKSKYAWISRARESGLPE